MSDWFKVAAVLTDKALRFYEESKIEERNRERQKIRAVQKKRTLAQTIEIERIKNNDNDIEKYPGTFSHKKFEEAKKAHDFIEMLHAEWKSKGEVYILIDSNVWMDASIDEFFVNFSEFIKGNNLKITVPHEQFDEIVNLKNKSYKDEKSKLARLAMARIETYLDSKLLSMKLPNHVANINAYLDVTIIKQAIEKAKNGTQVFLFTKDKEVILRIKAEDVSLENIHFLDVQDVLIKTIEYRKSKEIINEYNALKKRFHSEFVLDLGK
ncbi:PIN domain-containing protein [Deefgea rivuli]|uniref:PIN domain-containing protein n=1 Tax=Deefgea rivuli TaxID=400948 RepID=UPI000485E234|nr:PIN domain-containing protein [Deefgea rivuli]